MRLIDADKLHYKRVWIYDIQNGECRGTKSAVVVFADEIDKNKKARVDPDEVRGVGKWEMWEDYYGSNVYKCSVCGADWDMIEGTPQDNDFNYCPNCGAKMEVSVDA